LLDINLKGALDGVQTAQFMLKTSEIPIIYVTANTDEATFNRAKETRPYAFIAKPVNNLDLQRAIELTVSRITENSAKINEIGVKINDTDEAINHEMPFILSDRIFVKHKDKMVKLVIADILYIEAERNYCRIFTKNKEYLLSSTLKIMEEKLPTPLFVRVHRSFMVNLSQIDEVSDSYVIVNQKAIPLSHSLREDLLKRIQTI
jgi:DNA-binding LytR/AlgR family response regulator